MNKISKSPERNTFQKENYVKRQTEKNEPPSEAYLKMWDDFEKENNMREVDPAWQKDNLEYDLRSTEWILEKVRSSDVYAQNLYAAMCNMQFQKLDVLPILRDQKWSCSWRHAGGIIADMQEKGDYIDWYCSGIRGDLDETEAKSTKYVSEGQVTNEIREDLKKLGWIVMEWSDDE